MKTNFEIQSRNITQNSVVVCVWLTQRHEVRAIRKVLVRCVWGLVRSQGAGTAYKLTWETGNHRQERLSGSPGISPGISSNGLSKKDGNR